MSSEFADIGEMLDGEEFADMEIVEASSEDPDHPFWRISKQELAPLIKVMKDISLRNADQISKTILFEWVPGVNKVQLSLTNKDISFTGYVGIKNDQNVLTGNAILLLKQIEDLLKFSNEFLVYRDDVGLNAVLLKGTQPINEFKFTTDLYRAGTELGKVGDRDYAEVLREMTLFAQLMSLSSVVEDKKIIVKDGCAYGMFISTIARVSSQLPDVVIKGTDVRDLASLLAIYKDPVKVGSTKDKFVVRGENFQYSSLKISGEISELEIAKFVENPEGAFVDGNHAYSIFAYLTVTNSDTSVASIVNDQGSVFVKCKNRQGVTTKFMLTEGSQLENFDAQISVTKNVFRIMKNYSSTKIYKVGSGYVGYNAPGLDIIQGIREKIAEVKEEVKKGVQ